MSHCVTHDPTNWALLPALPFAGLGFDLQGVVQHAAALQLTPLQAVPAGERSMVAETPVAGYLLQLLLGRETRAG